MTMATILLAILWLLIILHAAGAFMTLCNAVRYRDVMVHLDADRIAHQPFQPKISLVIRCDPQTDHQPIQQIQQALALNYALYELILIVDSQRQPAVFDEVIRFFELKPYPLPEGLNRLRYPVQGYYRSRESYYKRLTVIDKVFYPDDDLRYTGAAVCKADYILFVRSLDNELIRSSLANLAIMKMRSPGERVSSIRGVARYECSGPFFKNIFRMLMDICNLRRIYVAGKFRNNDFGQFVTLEDISGKKGREEMIPQPQMYLHRQNNFRNYMNQLAPHLRYKTRVGRWVSYMELVIGLTFWGAIVHVAVTPGIVNDDFWFLLTALLLPLLASTFSILVGEIFLKPEISVGFVLRLLLLSIFETLLFCVFQPVAWIASQFTKRREV